jgi:hypothetical protein
LCAIHTSAWLSCNYIAGDPIECDFWLASIIGAVDPPGDGAAEIIEIFQARLFPFGRDDPAGRAAKLRMNMFRAAFAVIEFLLLGVVVADAAPAGLRSGSIGRLTIGSGYSGRAAKRLFSERGARVTAT